MHLCVVIPALNEAATIENVIQRVPRDLPDFDRIDIVLIDDGSTDGTPELAERAGAQVIRHARNLGVGAAFRSGSERAILLGADIMVNIDGDGQFNPEDIPVLLSPILNEGVDFVSASRFIDKSLYPRMNWLKFWGNKWMSRLISLLARQRFYDVSCGFRAYNRECLLRLNLFGDFTYTQESFLDLTFKGATIREVPIRIRGEREFGRSRVASNLLKYAWRSSKIILRAFRDYKPMILFSAISAVLVVASLLVGAFLLNHYLRTGMFTPHKWAGFAAGALLCLGVLTFITGLLADMLGRIRLNQERMIYMMRKQQDR
jgi:glycosyltransferase involved in cell wall biosynthesis